MPSILSHPALPLAIGLSLGSGLVSTRLLVAGVVASILPDADVIAFHFGIPHGSALGHRGLSHSIAFALIVGLSGAWASRALHAKAWTAFAFLFVATVSHGVLDSLTDGGQGIAFLWPLSAERFFAPFRVIEVSPIGVSRFLSARGVTVLVSEMTWVWLPCAGLAAALWAMRRRVMTSGQAASVARRP